MVYVPSKPPAVTGADGQALAAYLDDEMKSVASGLRTSDFIVFSIMNKAPTKARQGQLVYADGTNWDPGHGEGLYVYNKAGSWIWLEQILSGYLSTSDIGVTVEAFDAQLFSNIPQNSKSAAYTLVATDAEKHIFHPSADTTARIWTIPANSSVAFPIGTIITFVNQNAAGVITIAITTDTMRQASTGSTGSRTLAANGVATAIKVTATEWLISGVGLT